MPFLTDTLWRKLPAVHDQARTDSIMIAPWPDPHAERLDEAAEDQLNALMELIGHVRNLRSEYAVPAGAEISIRIANASEALASALSAEERAVRRLARVGNITRNGAGDSKDGAHAVLRTGGELFVPLADLIDVDKERERLSKDLERVAGQLRATEAKLTNDEFVNKAPAQVVDREREKAASLREQSSKLREKLEALV
jgi:valyl-tRNA synthetase